MGNKREGVIYQPEGEAYRGLTDALWGEKRQNLRPQMDSPAQPTLPQGGQPSRPGEVSLC